MNDTPQDELLSAYLDGELAPKERSKVERMLEESGESRQLLDELRALRATIQTLHRERLDPGFSKQVIQLAERTMLADSSAVGAPSIRPPIGPTSERDHDWRTRIIRPLIFAGLAIAAALTLMFLHPDQLGKQGPGGGIAREENIGKHREEAPAIGPNLQDDRGSDKDNGDNGVLGSPTRSTMAKEGGRRSRTVMESETEAIPRAASPAADVSETDMPAAKRGARQTVDTNGRVDIDADKAIDGFETTFGVAGISRGRSYNFVRSKQLVEQQLRNQSDAALPVYSIQLDVTPEAVRRRALDKTLERNHIQIASNAATDKTNELGGADEATEKKTTQAIAPVDVVYVEMTQSQLESVLADIANQPLSFSNIMVPADPAFVGQRVVPAEEKETSSDVDGDGATLTHAQSAPVAESTRSNPFENGEKDARPKRHESGELSRSMRGLAQRLQLPQLSEAIRLNQRATAKNRPELAGQATAKRQKDDTFREGEEKAGQSNERDAETPASDADRRAVAEQMFRALFIMRVVPSAGEATEPAEPPAAEEPRDQDANEP